ncbi:MULTISPECIES: phosphoribosyltransferase-like protein [Pseudomonas]|uniref:PRTase-CE domain-containing protein n=1 Tax=Pseudomonas mosselii TaxID=78327 RepID=A0A5R8Z706_9PSED|nr:hypothetical protein [Pseudomonas mosselii]TLP61324.1 hypothetical protein FEM01_12115 [Pseudomonas mosselii]
MEDFMEGKGIEFYENVLISTKTLISSSLWKDVNLKSLETWVSYFETYDEKVLCGFLLDSLIYRTNLQTSSLLFHALDRAVSQAVNVEKLALSGPLRKVLIKKYPGVDKDKIKIIPVIRDVDPPTKSGPLVARLYKKEVGVNDKFMAWPWLMNDFSDKVKLVVFIDDFVGTGEQFLEFLERFTPAGGLRSDIEYVYAPLGACTKGIEKISSEAPSIKLCYSELIEDGSKFFSGFRLRHKKASPEFVADLKATYLAFMDKVGHQKLQNKFGYGDLELSYVFSHGAPNATLPIFWAANEKYFPLFSR